MALSAPSGWIAQRDQDGAALVLRSPAPPADGEPSGLTRPGDRQEGERARGAVSVVIQELRSDETPEAFARRCRVDIEHLGTAVVVSGQDPVTLGGRIWTKVSYHLQVGRFTWQQELFATCISGFGYCVTCSSIESAFPRWQSAFAEILSGLERSRPASEAKERSAPGEH